MTTTEACTDEMVRLFPEVLQSCSEQVLKVLHIMCHIELVFIALLQELSATNTQCGSYCDLVCSLHHNAAKDNTR